MNLKKIKNIVGVTLLILALLVTVFSVTACERNESPTEEGDASPPAENPTTQSPTESKPTEVVPTEPVPTEPTPTEPTPTEPAPTEPPDPPTCEHAYDNACDESCNECGDIRTVGEHAYNNACDESCNECGDIRTVGEHVYDNACDEDCNVCGDIRTVGEHTYDNACDKSCNVCGDIRTVGEHIPADVDYLPPTCTESGVRSGEVCTECGYIISAEIILEPLGHDETAHDGRSPTCTEKGYEAYTTCLRCDFTTYKEIPATGHTEKTVWGKPATCEGEGFTDGISCSVCEAIIKAQEAIAPTGHTRQKVTGTPATCTQSGMTDGYKCSKCGKVLESQQYLPVIPHTEVIVPELAPTCTQSGAGEGVECSACKTVIKQGETIQPLGHDEELVAGTAPTCTKAGTSDGKWCKRCQTVTLESTEIPKLGHSYPSSYKYDVNYHRRSCTVCESFENHLHLFTDNVCPKCGFDKTTVINMTDHTSYKHAFDYVMLDGEVVASAATNPNTTDIAAVSITRGQAIQLKGWLGFKNGDKIANFGVYFDGMVSDLIIDPSFKAAAEQGVLDAGGEYRFTISGDTALLSEGKHTVTFVATLTNGKIVIMKTLKFDVPKTDVAIPDDEIVKAEKEQLGDVDMTLTGLGNSQYKSPAGLKFIASSTGVTFSNGQFTISAANGIKISIADYATRFAEDFNRYKIAYYSSTPLKAVVTYKEDGETYSDTVYLEAGDNMLFNCLIPGYLKGLSAKHIMSIDIQVLGSSQSATFVLYNVTTDNVEVISNSVKYIENARYRLGIKLAWGGGISYLRDNQDGISSVTNLINQADTGRLVQQSYYGTIDSSEYQPGYYGETKWHYNPVQGGSLTNSPSRIIDLEIAEGSVYVKAQPRDWAKSSLTPSYMENVYTLYANRIQVDNRFVDFAGYKTNPTRHQELPAFYTIGYLNTFKYYNGTNPWKNGALQVESNLSFWAGNKQQYFGLKNGNTETWCAWVNGANDYGVGLYVPNVDILYAGRHAYESDPDAVSASSGSCSYVAPLNSFKIVSYKPLEYSYLITTGSTNEIRTLFSQYKDFASNSSLTSADFGYKSGRT